MLARIRAFLGAALACALPTVAAQTPVEHEIANLVPSNADVDMGWSVGIDGDQILLGASWADVGASIGQGAAAAFGWNGAAWVETQAFSASDGRPYDHFGIALAMSGDWAVIGAQNVDIAQVLDVGAAYVLQRTAGGWVEQAKLFAPDGQTGDVFGRAVAIDGEWALVGAQLDDVNGKDNSGSACLFQRDAGGWHFVQQLLPLEGHKGDTAGTGVALSGEWAFVGAPNHAVADQSSQGVVHPFRRVGATWVEQPQLVASDGAAFDQFGTRLAADGDVLVVATPLDDFVAGYALGAAYVFRWNGSAWLEEQKLRPAAVEAGDRFGDAVAIRGDVLVVGAPDDVVDGKDDQGSAWVFRHDGSTWVEEQQLIDSGGKLDDACGRSVGVAGDVAVAGVPGAFTTGFGSVGKACVFDLLGPAWTWLGQALPGAQGSPALSAFGDLTAGNPVSFVLGQARPSAPVFVVLGLAAATVPFKGGVLVPSPDVALAGFATDGQGELSLASSWPGGVPAGFSFWAQDWIVDPAGPSGFAASNAVMGTAP